MDRPKTIVVRSPEGKETRIRLSSVVCVESRGVTVRHYYVRHHGGRTREVDRASAEAVFDAIQPQLF